MLLPTKTTRPLRSKALATLLAGFVILLFGFYSVAATFTNNASIQVTSDPSGSLTSASGVFTVSCWFRISVPSSATISDNMDILMDRSDGNEGANFSYLLRYNYINNAVEFVTKGSTTSYSKTLIQNPYLQRWYHVAVTRSGASFTCYVDGRPILPSDSANVGSTVGAGLSIGGVNGNSKQFSGDIVEAAIYSQALSQSVIQSRMFQDQRNFQNLKGYYKLGFSTNASDYYHNFVTNPPSGTDPASATGSGTITFGQVDEAGEQSIYDANRNHGADALTPLSGAFAWQQTAFARPTPGIGFDFEYGYSSALPTQAPLDGSSDPYDTRALGPRWRNSFDVRVVVNNFNLNEFDLLTWDGGIQTWTRTNLFASFSNLDKEYRGELVQLPTSEVQWTSPQRIVYLFRDPTDGTPMAGKLEQISDFNTNVVQLNWDEDNAIITSITDTAGGVYQFNYDSTRSLLTNITFGAWQVNFAYDSTNRLISKSIANTAGLYSAANTTWQFGYNTNGLLQQIIDPRGNTNILVLYDQYGRQTNLVDAVSRTTRIEYDVPATWQMRRTDPGGFQWIETYDHKGHVLSQNDPLGNTTSYTYDTNGNRTSITEPLGWTTSFGYDSRANVIAKTNALGEITTWAFHPFFNKAIQQITQQPADANGWTRWTNSFAYDAGGNLTNNSDALGALVNYTYSTNGLVLTSTDANGHTTSFTYDTNGFLLSKTDAATNTTTYTPNDVGWKLHEYDALGNPTSYTYDLNGNQTRIQDVLGRVFNKVYDGNGNLLSTTDGKSQLTTYAYDAANQKTNMVDRTGTNKWNYFYTTRGKLDHVTDALGYSATNIYDSANRLVSVIDPLGQSITNQYDNNGNLIAFYDKLGQRWLKTYDRLNRVISEADPLGDTRTTSFDVADRVQQITSPNGYPSTHTYDGRGRLTKWVDPQNFSWLYAYDGVGNITNITDALGGHYIMAYGPRNERTLEQNQDTNIWQYTYDELLRLKQQTDPNGTIRTPTYDNAGRVLFVDFNTGRRDSFNYDNNDNPVSISRRYSGVTTALQLIYDSLDRVVEQDDALGKTVLYGHDPLGRVTSITYPGGKVLTNSYDALGRLTKQVDWSGRQMNYAYDPADRLIYRSYPNGVVQTNTFDTAGRIAALSYAPSTLNSNSINTALTYAYDRNGNKTGSSESGVFNWPLPSLTDDSTGYTPAGKLINRQIQNNSATSNQLSTVAYHYDSSGNMTNAVMTTGGSTAQSWTLTYDEDNRTTSIYWQVPPLTSRMVTNRYDVMGRRISKTVDGVTTGYVLLLAGGMEKVLCDLDGSGNVTAWYVHGPDLCYRVDSTNGLLCYHADAMGNIIALTDGNTNLAAQYAYTPYGRSLGSTNFQSQISNPYLFVGSQGVQEESDIPNLYFMRARYYSADAGAFLSTDPIKQIGPSWKPLAYLYANGNPVSLNDPNGKIALIDTFAIAAVSEVLDEGAENITLDLAPDAGSRETAQQLINVKNAIGDGKDAIDGIKALNAGSEGAASYAVSQAGKYTGQAAYAIAPLIMSAYINGIYAAGNALDNVTEGIMNGYANGINAAGNVGGNILYSLGYGNQTALPLQSGTSSMASRTASVAAPQASGVTAATSTKPSGATGGGVTTSNGGSTITIQSGSTLSGIARQNGTTVAALVAANPQITNPNVIYAGASLNVPGRH
jgi:RHS repeat-associated protein